MGASAFMHAQPLQAPRGPHPTIPQTGQEQHPAAPPRPPPSAPAPGGGGGGGGPPSAFMHAQPLQAPLAPIPTFPQRGKEQQPEAAQ